MNLIRRILNINYRYSLVIAILALVIIIQFFTNTTEKINGIEDCSDQFDYLTPTIDCNEYDERSQKIAFLEDEIEDYLDENVAEGDRVGVWVRDLKSKRFAGVNSQSQFYLASLLKVPLLVSYYKMAEVDPSVLDRKVTYTGAHDDGALQKISPSEQLVKGKTYSVNELLFHAIVYSDNAAALELTALLPDGYLERTLSMLGLQIESPSGSGEVIITPRTYANVLRILYNSSYLSPYYSNEAIKLLLKTNYKEGVIAGFPSNIEVAHKFGERFFQVSYEDYVYQIHDCGIAYFEDRDNPVLFCIMTEGSSLSKVQSYLSDIAKLIANNLGK